jgi:hypothetical protein
MDSKNKVRRRVLNLHRFQNSKFVSENTIIQIKVITKVIYIKVNHDMFRPLLGYNKVYLCVLRC